MAKKYGFMVYWMFSDEDGVTPFSEHYDMNEMNKALERMELLRNDPTASFIGMVSQNPDHVGKPGASTILPADYQWSKQYRGVRDPNEPRSLIAPKAAE
jgi:hypothetical protein